MIYLNNNTEEQEIFVARLTPKAESIINTEQPYSKYEVQELLRANSEGDRAYAYGLTCDAVDGIRVELDKKADYADLEALYNQVGGDITEAIANQTFKTINGESVVGEGDIVISGGGDLSNYYTKEETEDYVTGWCGTKYNIKAENVECNLSSDRFDFSDVYGGFNQITDNIDIIWRDKQSKSDVTSAITSAINSQEFKTINGESVVGEGDIVISGGGDLSNYYTKEEIDELVGNINTLLESI